MLILIIITIITLDIIQNDGLIVGNYLSENGQMRVEQFPCWLQNQIDTLFGVVDHVTEYDDQTLECISLEVKELLGVGLDNLQEESYPGME